MRKADFNGEQSDGLSRRRLLRAGARLTAVAAVGSAVSWGGMGTANAALPASKHFNLPGAGGNPVWRATLQEQNWAMQSFAYDNVNQNIYFVQHRIGTLAGHNGDLWITRTDLSGKKLGSMTVHGFGHGSSVGVEPVGAGSAPYLWLEGYDSDDNGAGERLSRFRFVNGQVLEKTDPSIQDRTPTISSFAKLPRPAIDPYTNRLLIRYATQEPADRVWRIVVFDMADAKAGRLSDGYRLAERAIPTNAELGLSDSDLFQGITLCGQYAYLYFGGPSRPSYLVRLDMNKTGSSYDEKFLTQAGESLPGREAQGIAIWMSGGAPRLAFGYSSKTQASPEDILDASVFYKSEFVS